MIFNSSTFNSDNNALSISSTFNQIYRALETTYFFLLMALTPPGVILGTINNILVLITIAASPMLRAKTSQTALIYYIVLAVVDIAQFYVGHFLDLIGIYSYNIKLLKYYVLISHS